MKFRDKIERTQDEDVYLIRKRTDVEKLGYIEILRDLPQTRGECFCKTIIKYVKLGEGIFNKEGYYVTTRIE